MAMAARATSVRRRESTLLLRRLTRLRVVTARAPPADDDAARAEAAGVTSWVVAADASAAIAEGTWGVATRPGRTRASDKAAILRTPSDPISGATVAARRRSCWAVGPELSVSISTGWWSVGGGDARESAVVAAPADLPSMMLSSPCDTRREGDDEADDDDWDDRDADDDDRGPDRDGEDDWDGDDSDEGDEPEPGDAERRGEWLRMQSTRSRAAACRGRLPGPIVLGAGAMPAASPSDEKSDGSAAQSAVVSARMPRVPGGGTQHGTGANAFIARSRRDDITNSRLSASTSSNTPQSLPTCTGFRRDKHCARIDRRKITTFASRAATIRATAPMVMLAASASGTSAAAVSRATREVEGLSPHAIKIMRAADRRSPYRDTDAAARGVRANTPADTLDRLFAAPRDTRTKSGPGAPLVPDG